MAKPTSTPSTVGRPRRFDDETERKLLIDAAMRVMERNGFSAMSVNDVLEEAGMSTRAFYRHFDSKEALLESFMLREAEAVGRSLSRIVAAAPDPVAAVDAWLERFLDVFYEPRRARRTALLASATARGTGPSSDVLRQMRQAICRSLVDALQAGTEAGVLRSPTPEADAYSIHALVTSKHEAEDGRVPDRDMTKAHVLRFAAPALGLPLASELLTSRTSPP